MTCPCCVVPATFVVVGSVAATGLVCVTTSPVSAVATCTVVGFSVCSVATCVTASEVVNSSVASVGTCVLWLATAVD